VGGILELLYGPFVRAGRVGNVQGAVLVEGHVYGALNKRRAGDLFEGIFLRNIKSDISELHLLGR
jgi:hypothetical protein